MVVNAYEARLAVTNIGGVSLLSLTLIRLNFDSSVPGLVLHNEILLKSTELTWLGF